MRGSLFVVSIFCFLLFCSVSIQSQQTVPLPDLLNPSKISVGDRYLYILQEATIFVYGLDDFQLKKQFGKIGEGPGEFTVGRRFSSRSLDIFPIRQDLMVSCRNKVLMFSDLGDFVHEKKMIGGFGSLIYPMGNDYVSQSFSGFRSSNPTRSINLYGSDLKKIRELYTQQLDNSRFRVRRNTSSKYNEFSSSYGMAVGAEKVYVFDSNRFNIQVINRDGKRDSPISVEYKPVKINNAIRDGLMDYYKNYRFKGSWDRMKDRLEIPSVYPAIQTLMIADGILFVQTFKTIEDSSEFFLFNNNHALDKVLMLPLARINERAFYPFYFKNGKLYQVVEDEDEEEWVLRIHNMSLFEAGTENQAETIKLKK